MAVSTPALLIILSVEYRNIRKVEVRAVRIFMDIRYASIQKAFLANIRPSNAKNKLKVGLVIKSYRSLKDFMNN